MITNSKYDFNQKNELLQKINRIKKKKYQVNIFKIISSHTNNYVCNNNGVYILFHDLPDIVYTDLELYVNEIYKKYNNKINNKVNFNISETIKEYSESINDKCESEFKKKLSNKERAIHSSKKYQQYLNNQ